MSKGRPCHHHEVSSFIQDILNVMYDSLQSLAQKKIHHPFWYKKHHSSQNRHKCKERLLSTKCEKWVRLWSASWRRNRRDNRKSTCIYRSIYIGHAIDEHLSIYLMTASCSGRFDKDVYDIEKQYYSSTGVSTTETQNLTMRIIEYIMSNDCIKKKKHHWRIGWLTFHLESIYDFCNHNKAHHEMIVTRYLFSSSTIEIIKRIRISKKLSITIWHFHNNRSIIYFDEV